LGHPSKFQRVSRLGIVTAPTSLNGGQPNFARCLAVFCASTLCIHFGGLLPPNGIMPGAKFTLRPSFAFSYIGSVTARQSSSGRKKKETTAVKYNGLPYWAAIKPYKMLNLNKCTKPKPKRKPTLILRAAQMECVCAQLPYTTRRRTVTDNFPCYGHGQLRRWVGNALGKYVQERRRPERLWNSHCH